MESFMVGADKKNQKKADVFVASPDDNKIVKKIIIIKKKKKNTVKIFLERGHKEE